MLTRSGFIVQDRPKRAKPPPKKKPAPKKRVNPYEDELKNVKKIRLEGENVFERFESLLSSSNNLEKPITLAQIIALQDGETAQDKIKRHTIHCKYQRYDMLAQSYNKSATFYDKTPDFINATLRDYQIAGLNWLLSLQKAGLNGVLADEMGLGKTLQTIALIAHNKFVEKAQNPTLVIVPLSTLLNWESECKKFCPELRCFVLHGTMEERVKMCRKVFYKQKFDVMCVSYETAVKLSRRLNRVHFNYIVIDEAQRIKNDKVALAVLVQRLRSNRRLLLTGTPFQNDIHELWSLLNYLAPAIFADAEKFEEYFSDERMSEDISLVNRLHKILNPFILRRVKSDVEKELLPKKMYKVYVGLTELQKKWYAKVLQKEIDTVNKSGQRSTARISHILMALREVSNHPYMFPAAEPSGPPFITDETIVTSCGKMIALDKMLQKFEAEGSRVLIFSQFTMMLDILEDYVNYREYEYCRFDGEVEHEERHRLVNEFNAEDSKKFIFLMSTRSGGLGINLATADVVIIYDSDWNPQMDFQAIDRAHRIGQKKQVRVFRLISEDTVDDYIIRTNEHKVRLGGIVIQDQDQMMLKTKTKMEMLEMIIKAAHKVSLGSTDKLANLNIDELLDEAEKRTNEENSKKMEELEANDRFLCPSHKEHEMYDYSGKNHWGLWPKNNEIEIYDERLRKNPRTQPIGERALTLSEFWQIFGLAYSHRQVVNYRFYPERYVELVMKKLIYLRSVNQILLIAKEDDVPNKRKAEDLTEPELAEMEQLKKQAASNWSFGRFLAFVSNLVDVDKNDYGRIGQLITCKEEEVKKYCEVLWERNDELPMKEEILGNVKQFEEREAVIEKVTKLLNMKVAKNTNPSDDMTFNYSLVEWKKPYETLLEEDRFYVALVQKIGYCHGSVFENELMNAMKLRKCNQYRHWPIQKLGVTAIRERFMYLVEVIEKEFETGEFVEEVKPKVEIIELD